jgi:hypothetical protein
MADIFISYSKSDHALALKLSAFLESKGWTVWWDKSLGAADLYRDEIMKQLAAARAVITIWTPNSIKSDWVRAEAGRAKADGKLIPVKTPELTYGDIPLPFGEMHTENVSSTELIRAAVVAQLAKPAVTPSPFWQITGVFKYQALTWIGIVGSAITLFANLRGVLDLADWARELARHWHEWNQLVFAWLFNWINVKIPPEMVPIISFSLFAALLVVGTNLSERFWRKAGEATKGKAIGNKKVKVWAGGIGLYLVGSTLLVVLFSFAHQPASTVRSPTLLVLIGVSPLVYLMVLGKERGWILINSLLVILLGTCLIIVPLSAQMDIYKLWFVQYEPCIWSDLEEQLRCDQEVKQAVWQANALTLSTMLFFPPLWITVIAFSPLKHLARRLAFVVLGVITLVALSEISKLHHYLQPAKVSEHSSPLAAQISLCGIHCNLDRLDD